MREVLLALLIAGSLCNLALCIELEEGKDYILFKCSDYHLWLSKTAGTFDFLIKDKEGVFRSIHRPEGEKPWFGYNSPRGELRSSLNIPRELEVRKWREGFEVSLITPLEEDVFQEGEFFIAEDYLLVRSLIKAEGKGGISIVRLAPRFEVDIEIFQRFAFSVPGGIVSGLVNELGRPGYAGVGGWGGPKSYGSLDPTSPFFALYNPDLQLGFLFLYPFYERLWKGKHIFLQLWEGGVNYLYAGWGEEKDIGKEVLFAIVPLKVFSPEEIAKEAEKLNGEIEENVKKKELPFPSLLNLLVMEDRMERNWGICQEFIDERLSQLGSFSQAQLREWENKIFEVQKLFLCSRIAFERGDYKSALLYSEEMLRTLGISGEISGKF